MMFLNASKIDEKIATKGNPKALMDEVLKKHSVVIDTKRHKPFQYFKLLTTDYERIIQIFKTLDKRESNIGVLFD